MDEAALQADILGVLYATGIAREDTETAALWHDEDPDSHLELAQRFTALPEAPDPLDPLICKDELRSELNAMIRSCWTAPWQREGGSSLAAQHQLGCPERAGAGGDQGDGTHPCRLP